MNRRCHLSRALVGGEDLEDKVVGRGAGSGRWDQEERKHRKRPGHFGVPLAGYSLGHLSSGPLPPHPLHPSKLCKASILS